jgi:hypothetical protein
MVRGHTPLGPLFYPMKKPAAARAAPAPSIQRKKGPGQGTRAIRLQVSSLCKLCHTSVTLSRAFYRAGLFCQAIGGGCMSESESESTGTRSPG